MRPCTPRVPEPRSTVTGKRAKRPTISLSAAFYRDLKHYSNLFGVSMASVIEDCVSGPLTAVDVERVKAKQDPYVASSPAPVLELEVHDDPRMPRVFFVLPDELAHTLERRAPGAPPDQRGHVFEDAIHAAINAAEAEAERVGGISYS